MKKVLKLNGIFTALLIWLGVSLIDALVLNQLLGLELGISIADSLVHNTIYLIIAVGLWFMVRYSNLMDKQVFDIIYNHLGSMVVTTATWLFFSYFLLDFLIKDHPAYHTFLYQSLVFRGITGVFYYAVLVSIFYLMISYKELKEKLEHEAELNQLLRNTELNMLRSQIRPHFLFNALNSISSLTMSAPEQAQQMIVKLSDLMRYSLEFKEEKRIPLSEELYHIELYLDIEKIRFGQKMEFEKAIQEECLQMKVPALILQPLIENSIKHGLYEATSTCKIRLEVKQDNKRLKLVLMNDYDPEQFAPKGTGTGLKNTKKRLTALYSSPDIMRSYSQDNKFIVELLIPQYEEN